MFYNPAMAADRDLGVAFARAWFGNRSVPPTGWEMTAATGVRGLRLLDEVGAFAAFTFSEANPRALEVLRANAAGRPGVTVVAADARRSMGGSSFDYVDLDPYGTPVPFLPAAFAAVRPGGVLAVTATDMMVLAGAQPATCLRRYGARPVRGRLGPEGGLRILLAHLVRVAQDRGRVVRPLLAYVLGHHVRAYLAVDPGPPRPEPIAAIDPATWTGPDLGGRGPYGPLWLGPLFDGPLVRKLEVPPTAARPSETRAFLERLREEVAVDVPFYYEANRLARALGLARPAALPEEIADLRARGFRAARTHARPEGFRTDAPRPIVESSARTLAASRQSQNERVRA